MNINLLLIFIILFNFKDSFCCCKFRGIITPSLNEETKKPIKWQVNLECEYCIKGGKKQQKTIINTKNGKGANFEFDLIPAVGKAINKLKIKISSLERLIGLERTNNWILKNLNFERLHRFQFGHFLTFSNEKKIYLRLKFTRPLEENLLVKLEENDELKMQYYLTIVEAKDRKIILASRPLTEPEWKDGINIDIYLNKQKVINYMRTSKQYPMAISVKAIPTIDCELCKSRKKTKLKTKVQKLHMIPNCKHFVHKKCANKTIRKKLSFRHLNKRQAKLDTVKEEEDEGKETSSTSADPKNPENITTNTSDNTIPPPPPPPLPPHSPHISTTPPHHLHSCSSSSSSSLSSCPGSPSKQTEIAISSSSNINITTNNEDQQIKLPNYFEDKCPVTFCDKVVQMKSNASGKESIIFDKIKLREKKVFDALLVMPILQNGESPEYIYYFEPKKRSIFKKVKTLFKKINLNKVDEDDNIEEEIINNEADELRLDETSFRREGFGSRRIEGINVIDTSTQTENDLIEQTSNENTINDEINENKNSETAGESNKKDLKEGEELNKTETLKKEKEELNKQKNKQPIKEKEEERPSTSKQKIEQNNQVEDTINVSSYEKSTSSENDEDNNNNNLNNNNNRRRLERINDNQQQRTINENQIYNSPNDFPNIYENPYYYHPSEEAILASTYDVISKFLGYDNNEEKNKEYYNK